MKALLDRLQPYFHRSAHAAQAAPLSFMVGAGGDPPGFEPLIGTVRSALSVASSRWSSCSTGGEDPRRRRDHRRCRGVPAAPSALRRRMGLGRRRLRGHVEVERCGRDRGGRRAEGEVERIEIADADDAWDGFRDGRFDSRRGGCSIALPADDSREDIRPKDRAKLSVSQKAPAPKQGAPKSGSRGPRKSSSKGGGPAYGKKNTKKKGNGRGGHR